MNPDNEEARRDLIADISHDLRAPLVAMRGYLEVLVSRGASLSPADRQSYAEIALGQSERLARLVDDLFELAKLDFKGIVLDREGLAVAELASDVIQKFSLAASSRNVRLSVAAEPGLAHVVADPRLMERVFENLISNAMRYTPEGGLIEVRLAVSGEVVQVEVQDTGSGISAAELPFVFDRHFRGAPAAGDGSAGAGLGLAIARRIVELHGGRLEVESEPVRGTCFRFALPVEK